MLVSNLDNSFIYYECCYSFPFVNRILSKSLNPVPDKHVTPLFSSRNITNVFDVFLKLKPRKYKYKEYITTIVEVLFSFKSTYYHRLEWGSIAIDFTA